MRCLHALALALLWASCCVPGACARLPEQPPRPLVPGPRPVAAMLSSDLFWNYTLYVDLLDWDDAEAVCERAGGALAWFEGPRDWRRLAALVLSLWKQRWPTDPRHCPHCGCAGEACWFQAVGYYGTRARQGTWRSVAGGDGTWLPPWGPNQPDFCGSEGETRSCAQMWIEGADQNHPLDTMPITLSDAPCSCKLPFACKVPTSCNAWRSCKRCSGDGMLCTDTCPRRT